MPGVKSGSGGRRIQPRQNPQKMIRARVRSGIENARAKGRQIRRPQVSKEDIPASFLRHYPAYKSKQLNVSELARVCHISRTTVYKYIGLLEG